MKYQLNHLDLNFFMVRYLITFNHTFTFLTKVFSLPSLPDHELFTYLSINPSNHLANELAMCLSICLFFESQYKCDSLVKPCLIPQPQAELVASSSLCSVLCSYYSYINNALISSSIIILPYFNIKIYSIRLKYWTPDTH